MISNCLVVFRVWFWVVFIVFGFFGPRLCFGLSLIYRIVIVLSEIYGEDRKQMCRQAKVDLCLLL